MMKIPNAPILAFSLMGKEYHVFPPEGGVRGGQK